MRSRLDAGLAPWSPGAARRSAPEHVRGGRLLQVCCGLLSCMAWTACTAGALGASAAHPGSDEPRASAGGAGPRGLDGATRADDEPRASAQAASKGAGLRGLDYTFRADPELTRLEVRLCLHGDPPERLVHGSKPSALFVRDSALVSLEGIELPRPRPLPLVDDRIQLGVVPGNACVTYEVDLRAALEHERLLVAYPTDGGVVTSTELFLWRPALRPPGLRVRARFELPEGIGVSVPWQRDEAGPHRYVLDEMAFAFTGHALLGRLEAHTLNVPSATVTVAMAPGFEAPQRTSIARWIEDAARMVSLPSGRFPVPHAQVIVVPTSPNTFPIRFGHTGRSGGGSILIFLPADVDPASLRTDWIAVHELSHLLHPFVLRDDAWLSEGLATYLQEVLRVRAGVLEEAQAWRRLYEGAELRRDARGDLASETERMPGSGNYPIVYWAGAAIALMTDVELRRRSDGRDSLDRALSGLQDRPALMSRPVRAAELLAALDRAVGGSVFRDVAARYLEGDELPDLAPLYRELGLLDERGRLVSRPDAPLAWVRDAIMARE